MSGPAEQWSDNEILELRKVFYAQAYELVEDLQEQLLRLESDARDDGVLKTVKRCIHTLKGDANSVGLLPLGALCHRMEDLLAGFMDGKDGAKALEILLAGVDTAHRLLAESEKGSTDDTTGPVIERIDRFLCPQRADRQPGPGPAARSMTEYQELQVKDALQRGLRVYDCTVSFHPDCGERGAAALMLVKRLESCATVIACMPSPESPEIEAAGSVQLVLAAELDREAVTGRARVAGIALEVEAVERLQEQSGPARSPEDRAVPQVRSELLRVDAAKVDHVMDLLGEIIIGRSMIEEIARDADGAQRADVAARLQTANAYMDRAVSDLQKSVMKMRMVPVHSVFRKFSRLVRDLAREKGKIVRVDLIGSETELDKRIVDALDEPLAHLIRNAVDHGIEAPGERVKAGKAGEGVISLKAYHEASQIVIEIRDDGRGIDREAMKRKAVEQGAVSPEDAAKLNDGDALRLMFLSGLSTAPTVSETSGRGVGMDAVQAAVDRLKGSIEIEAATGNGTLFRLRLPLTLAIINGLLFEVGPRLYAVPVPAIAEVARIAVSDLVTIEGRKTLLLRDQIISIVSLEELFGVAGNGSAKKYVLILALAGRRIGLLIDRLMWQQELVIKAIDDAHLQTEYVSGGSILGNGKVVLILDAQAIVRAAIEVEKNRRHAAR